MLNNNNNNNNDNNNNNGLLLGANICEPHQCPCGVMTDAKGLHGLSCKGGTGRSARHHNLNDLVWRALGKANIPSVKEPTGLFRSDGKRPDVEKRQMCDLGCDRHRHFDSVKSIINIQRIWWSSTGRGRPEVTEICSACTDLYLCYYICVIFVIWWQIWLTRIIGLLWNAPSKFVQELKSCHVQWPKSFHGYGHRFIREIGRRAALCTADPRETTFLYQRFSIAIQRFNLICLANSFSISESSW